MPKYNRKDSAYTRAKKDGYRSRAAYKLLELDSKYSLFGSKSKRIVDLGAAPGSWLQVVEQKLKPSTRVVGIDIVEIEPFNTDSIRLIIGDISSDTVMEEVESHLGAKADLVLSDMSNKLSGIYFRDVCASAELLNLALNACSSILSNNGNFVGKFFPGEETELVVKQMKKSFKSVKTQTLKSTRKSSKEKYVIAKGFNHNKI